MRALHVGTSWGGLFAGPLAWAVSTQLNYVLAPWGCAHDLRIVPAVAVVLAVLALAGGALSWRAYTCGGASFKAERDVRTERFVAMLGIMAALLFALVILMQGAAALILNGCER
jgi:hypothetical protein